MSETLRQRCFFGLIACLLGMLMMSQVFAQHGASHVVADGTAIQAHYPSSQGYLYHSSETVHGTAVMDHGQYPVAPDADGDDQVDCGDNGQTDTVGSLPTGLALNLSHRDSDAPLTSDQRVSQRLLQLDLRPPIA